MKNYLTLNLEQQVAKNANDILAIVEGGRLLGELGIVVVGNVATEEILNETYPPRTYTGAYGDAFLVGTEPPYDYYIFTRPFVGESVPQWFNIGQFPLPGPKGEQGPVGEVKKGDRGSLWYVGQASPDNFTPATPDAFREDDCYLQVPSGVVYTFNGTVWVAQQSILGPRGNQGERGIRGTRWFYLASNPTTAALPNAQDGDMCLNTTNASVFTYSAASDKWTYTLSIKGDQGEQGKPATSVEILGIITQSQLSSIPAEQNKGKGYLITISGSYHLFTPIPNGQGVYYWTDVGSYSGGTQVSVGGTVQTFVSLDNYLTEAANPAYNNIAYVQTPSGPSTITIEPNTYTANTIVARGVGGEIICNDSHQPNSAATKSYVDGLHTDLHITSATGTNSIVQAYDESKYNYTDTFEFSSTTAGTGSVAREDIAGNYAVALGGYAAATGERAVAAGNTTWASGDYSFASGNKTKAQGANSHTEGRNTWAQAINSHAEGDGTIASGESSHSEGYGTRASGYISHAEGSNTNAVGSYTHAEGYKTTARYNASHAEGCETNVSYQYGHAEGYKTHASSQAAHAEGYNTQASGWVSHAEGNTTTASGTNAHAEGQNTWAIGDCSHTEGQNTRASSLATHASGIDTVAQHTASAAMGKGTQTNAQYQLVCGSYNAASNDLFTVGNGTGPNARSNAFAVKSNTTPTIRLGNTELTEAQLQALLRLI